VKFSAKSDYAARAVLGLARRHSAGRSVRAEDLAEEQGIPQNYLVQILIELKAQGIVRSQRGKEGGYFLGRPPAEITMGDVIKCVQGEVFESPALDDAQCPPELKNAWLKLQKSVETAAKDITFQKLLEQSQDRGKMYYI
jgi:Rrf2 family protein